MKPFRTIAFLFSLLTVLLYGCSPQKPIAAPIASPATSVKESELEIAREYCKQLMIEVVSTSETRLFADVADDTSKGRGQWREFKIVNQYIDPRGDKYRSNAQVWIKGKRVVYATLSSNNPSRDAGYYFWGNGILAKIESSFVTFSTPDRNPLLIIEVIYFNRQGKLLSKQVGYKDKKTGKVKKTEKHFKNPLPLYKRTSELPFYKLLVR